MSVITKYQIVKQENQAQIDASKISHWQKTAKQQKEIATVIAEKNAQHTTTENTAMDIMRCYRKFPMRMQMHIVVPGITKRSCQ